MSRFLRRVREIIAYENTNDIDVSLPEWSKDRGKKFWSMQDMKTRLLSANLDFDRSISTRLLLCT